MGFFSSNKFIIYAALLVWSLVAVAGNHVSMQLEKIVPGKHKSEISHFLARDHARIGRIVKQHKGLEFPLEGDNNVLITGIYYTTVNIGSPPKQFRLIIDSGSDITWLSCVPCHGCPITSNMPFSLQFYNPRRSSTTSLITCSDQICDIARESSDSSCSSERCSYKIGYGDGSSASGFYVSDLLHSTSNISNASAVASPIPIFFGCSTIRKDIPLRAFDGIFGLGLGGTSIISQLVREGIAYRGFAHCLRGGDVGGGSLVFGHIMEPDVVYTPLISSDFYKVDLQSISVDGRLLAIDPSTFVNSESQGVMFDSGTTYAYLPEGAYNPLISAITTYVSKFGRPYISEEMQCYEVNSSNTFPRLSLNFAGSASLIVTPLDYLVADGPARWCIGFHKLQQLGLSILGDVFLKDKIIIYDLECQRIGWVNHNCSLPIRSSRIHKGGTCPNSSSVLTINQNFTFLALWISLCVIVSLRLL